MAERNQLKIADRNEVAEDDPFAELTRIMGFDPREPVSRPGEMSAAREPAFEDDFGVDLEKELLGDFSPADDLAAAPHQAYTPAPSAYAPVAAQQPVYQPEPEAIADDFAAVEFDALEEALQPEPAYAAHEEPRFDDDIEAALTGEGAYAPHDEPRFDADIEAALSDQPDYGDEAALDFAVEPEHFAPAPQAAREPSFDDGMNAFEDELRATLADAPAEEPLPYFPSRPQAAVAPEPVAAPAASASNLEDELNALLGNMSAQTRQPEPARAPQAVAIPEPDFGDLDWSLDADQPAPAVEAPRYAEEAAPQAEWASDAADDYAADESHGQQGFDDFELDFDDQHQEPAPLVPQVAAAAAVTAATAAPVVAAAPLVKGNGILSSMRSGAARAWGLSTPIAPRADGSAQPASERVARSEPAFAPAPAAAPIVAAAPVAALAAQPEPELDFSDADLDLFEQEMSFDEPEAFAAAPVEAPVAYEPEPVAYAAQTAYEPQQAYAPQETGIPEFDLDFGADAQDDLEAELLAAVSNTVEMAPDIETMDVPEQAVALADDLDLPEIAFEEASQPSSSFDDFDHDFGDLIGDIGNAQSSGNASQAAFAAAAGAAGTYAMSYGRNEAKAATQQAPQTGTASSSAYQFDEELFNNPARNEVGASDDLDYDPDFDEAMATAEYGEGEKRSRKGLMLAAAVAAVAVIGGVGAFALSVGGGSGSGDATLVKADSEPLKVKPENPGGTVIPNQDNKVYDRVAGAAGGSTTQKNLVNEAEEPVDIKPAPVEQDETAGLADAPKSEDRLEQVINQDNTPAAETAAVSPRKVRTMVVRSDGSLAPREEPAGANVQANEPADPAPQRVASTPSNESTGAVAPAASQTPTALSPANRTTANTPATAPVVPQRPAAQPVDVVGEVKPQQVAAAPAATTAAAGAWAMQIASQPSEAAAQSTFQDLAKRYPGVLGGKQASIVKAEIAGKGTFWRVRIPAATRNDAISLCESYKAAGGNCFVSR